MNILQLATVDNGGATWFYKQALDLHTGHQTRAVRRSQGWIEYPVDVLAPGREELAKLYRWADVVHVHDDGGALIGRKWRAKPTVVTYHGTRFRRFSDQYRQRAAARHWRLTVSTLDLARHAGEWLPTPRIDLSEEWNPARQFVVIHAPTHRDRKLTEMVIEAVALAPGCKLRLIEGQPYLRCIRKKLRGHVLVDGFHYGYGNNSVEAWAMGMPSICGVEDGTRQAMLEAWGYLPFARALPTVEGLVNLLERLRSDADYYEVVQERGRMHYNRYHAPAQVARRLGALYEKARG